MEKASERKLRSEEEKPLKVEFNVPAQHWEDAIPIGNGRFGAMIWGIPHSEIINFNDDTLWSGIPGDYTDPEAPKNLQVVRKLVDNAQFFEATNEAAKLSSTHAQIYRPLGDMLIEFDESHSSYNKDSYWKELDLNTATARIKYSVGEIEYTREHFASYPDQVIVTKISASKPGSLSFTVCLGSQLDYSLKINDLNTKNYQIIMEGNCGPNCIQFCATLDLKISENAGSVNILDGNKLKVEGCDWVILLMVAASSFDGPFIKPSDSKRVPNLECVNYLNTAKNISYQNLYARHLDDYQKLFNRISLQLSKSSKIVGENVGNVSTGERVKSFKTDEDPSLVELLFQFGRYLVISSSRPGTQVSNLQGIWSHKFSPPWEADPKLNINTQMNYWPSLSCNLHECQEPLIDFVSSLALNGTKTAHVNYEASGWVVHSVSDVWCKTSADYGDPVWALWPMGGAWLSTHLWEHFLYTMDKGFLESKAYPLLERCTLFLLDWLIEGKDGYLETNPSTSPEHKFKLTGDKTACVSYSSTMDMSIIREVFINILSAAEVLGKSEDDHLLERVYKALPRLLPTKIAPDGCIMEWVQDFQVEEVEYHNHRHLSHLFGLFPGHTITVEKTPDLCKAADNSLRKREGPAWSTAWKTALWARLRNTERAYTMVKHLFVLVEAEQGSNGGLYSNLFTAHPPFQIDGNFGFSAAIAEMLVQSTMKDVILLPTLPRDKWANGCVKGLKARGGITVNICWKKGDLHQVDIWSNNTISIKKTIHYGGTIVDATILGGRVYTFNKQLKCVKMHSI